MRRFRPAGRKPFWAASFLAFGCVAVEGQGPPGIGASATPCQKPKMPAAPRVLTYWTLSKLEIVPKKARRCAGPLSL